MYVDAQLQALAREFLGRLIQSVNEIRWLSQLPRAIVPLFNPAPFRKGEALCTGTRAVCTTRA